MNRFSTAHKLNKSSGIYSLKSDSYKQQLLDVIALQQKHSENGSSSSSVAFPQPSVSDPSPFLVPSVSAPPPTEAAEFSNGNMKSKQYGNGDGELDMLFGFFIMNGACIVFFLLFGVCVICNCAARKPKFHGSEEKKKKPTVSRLVASIAPGGFSSKEKAKGSVATQKMEENGGNTPLLLPEKQNANRSSERRTGKSFKSLVVRAMAASRGEMPQGETDVERQQSVAPDATARVASPPSTGVSFATNAPPDRPSAQRCSPSDSRRTSGASSRRPSAVTNCCPMTASECGGCCPVRVVEVPVEVEMHHLCHQSPQHILLDPASPPPSPSPPPLDGNSLLPPKTQQWPSHRCAVSPTRSVPSDLCKAAQQKAKSNNNHGKRRQQQPHQRMSSRPKGRQQIQSARVNHCGDFAVVKRSDWAQLSLRSPQCHHQQQSMGTHMTRHRCSLVVPVTCECHEMEQEEEEEELEGEGGEEASERSRQREEGERDGERDKQSEQSDRQPQQQFSVVRQNLLGPLSFDDLYYM